MRGKVALNWNVMFEHEENNFETFSFRMEMRIGGNFAHDAHNGFRRILRYPNGAGVDFWDFYTKGVTDSHQDR